jgi:uncharacterized protein YecE (DUF72 family)
MLWMTSLNRDDLKSRVQRLAADGVLLGTSSWKYPGWSGMLYDEARYIYRGKFAKSRFEKNCLAEYAEVLKTVCVDAAYYTFPTEKYLQGLAEQVPSDFQFGFKVTDTVTLKRFHNHPRHGSKAGKENPDFLNADAFFQGFLRPCASIRQNVGLLMFEFSRFYPSDFEHGRDFVAALDAFLGKLPTGWPYGIEMRNRYWLKPEYFECLARHRVTHVYNSWTEMPPIDEQMQLAGSETNHDLAAARFLLKPGRKYEEAVESFSPYAETKEVNESARQAGAALIQRGKKNPKGKTFIFVNNRLEGNALNTIRAMLDIAESDSREVPGVDTSPP